MPDVLLFADEPILALGLRRSLEETDGLKLVSVCAKLEDLSRQLDENRPDIVLVDLTADVTFGVLSELRDAPSAPKIVLWVHSIPTELALQAVSLGVRGILRRTLPVETLVRCLQRVGEGELWFARGSGIMYSDVLKAKRSIMPLGHLPRSFFTERIPAAVQ